LFPLKNYKVKRRKKKSEKCADICSNKLKKKNHTLNKKIKNSDSMIGDAQLVDGEGNLRARDSKDQVTIRPFVKMLIPMPCHIVQS
jgi:hypothetical protein